ncbi:HAD-IA family hydrolase [Deinococcus detaillensis]|uniref:HAD-IA family hydrolase n=1 Tax=Deinococcus detaillensis TaxID=2592048 RepID=A0A553V2V1_9DEIO|nr:HAD-IA family hydrolase [Deinococcus detaillensis]TSA86803.1 HAD-IA family hydrolase [Deinococcus detaillensis]
MPFEQVRPLMGMGGDKIIPKLTGIDADSKQGKSLIRGWSEAFRKVISMTSGEVEASKPDADIVAVALRKFGIPASAALMVGDTHYDAEAAQKAGVRYVLLRRSGGNMNVPGEFYDDELLLEVLENLTFSAD